jgi:hypothetical protein
MGGQNSATSERTFGAGKKAALETAASLAFSVPLELHEICAILKEERLRSAMQRNLTATTRGSVKGQAPIPRALRRVSVRKIACVLASGGEFRLALSKYQERLPGPKRWYLFKPQGSIRMNNPNQNPNQGGQQDQQGGQGGRQQGGNQPNKPGQQDQTNPQRGGQQGGQGGQQNQNR